MRFMILVRATHISETRAMPSQKLIEAMGKYNQADIIHGGGGLQPSSKGARVAFSGKDSTARMGSSLN